MPRFSKNRRGRPLKNAQPSDRIADALRAGIVDGTFKSGERFPSRAVLMMRYRVTSNTLNSIIRELANEGFIRAEGREGTFVVDNPPHRSRYGLVFRGHPSGMIPEEWSHYWTLLEQEARRIGSAQRVEVASYYGVSHHYDEPDFQRLALDIRHARLAGLILVYPYGGRSTKSYEDFQGPLVTVGDWKPPRAVALKNDIKALVHKAAGYFAAGGRKRVAWIGEAQHEGLRTSIRAATINGQSMADLFPEDMAIVLNASSRATARPLVRFLMRQEPRFRPDAILVMDDHLAEHAARGLLDAGVDIPRDLELVAHCNYPAVPSTPIPVRWLGFDAAALIRRAFDYIKSQGENRNSVPEAIIPALWEEEWRASSIGIE